MSTASTIMPGAEPWSHRAGEGAPGLLALHGFTGSPSSMRGVAESCAAAGFHVELPLLPGHGTTLDDLRSMGWHDWTAAVAESFARLAAITDRIVVAGQSMGGALTLWTALHHGPVQGIVCINPATEPPPADMAEMVQELIADGIEVVPGNGSDIADPDAVDVSYADTPLRPLRSLVVDGLTPLHTRYGEITAPMLLITSRQDHVVPPEQSDSLAATYGGPVERIWLERSYHVATKDYERDLVVGAAVEFARKVAA
jgi:carboxylesterase